MTVKNSVEKIAEVLSLLPVGMVYSLGTISSSIIGALANKVNAFAFFREAVTVAAFGCISFPLVISSAPGISLYDKEKTSVLSVLVALVCGVAFTVLGSITIPKYVSTMGFLSSPNLIQAIALATAGLVSGTGIFFGSCIIGSNLEQYFSSEAKEEEAKGSP